MNGGRSWRPSWSDYSEVVTGLTEGEVLAFVCRVVRKHIARAPAPGMATLRVAARAGIIGHAPGWRRALRPDLSAIDKDDAATVVQAIERALAPGRMTLDERDTLILRRAAKTMRSYATIRSGPRGPRKLPSRSTKNRIAREL